MGKRPVAEPVGQSSATQHGVSPIIVVKTGRLTGFGESMVVSGAIGNTSCDFIINTGSNITILLRRFLEVQNARGTVTSDVFADGYWR